MIQIDAKLSCFIEEEDDLFLLFVNLSENMSSLTLEYSDITEELHDFFEVNEIFDIYEDENEIIKDLEIGHMDRFLGKPRDNPKLDLMVNLRMKMNHRNGTCGDYCIFCNPDIGEDPFPDFTFNIRNMEPEGEA